MAIATRSRIAAELSMRRWPGQPARTSASVETRCPGVARRLAASVRRSARRWRRRPRFHARTSVLEPTSVVRDDERALRRCRSDVEHGAHSADLECRAERERRSRPGRHAILHDARAVHAAEIFDRRVRAAMDHAVSSRERSVIDAQFAVARAPDRDVSRFGQLEHLSDAVDDREQMNACAFQILRRCRGRGPPTRARVCHHRQDTASHSAARARVRACSGTLVKKLFRQSARLIFSARARSRWCATAIASRAPAWSPVAHNASAKTRRARPSPSSTPPRAIDHRHGFSRGDHRIVGLPERE